MAFSSEVVVGISGFIKKKNCSEIYRLKRSFIDLFICITDTFFKMSQMKKKKNTEKKKKRVQQPILTNIIGLGVIFRLNVGVRNYFPTDSRFKRTAASSIRNQGTLFRTLCIFNPSRKDRHPKYSTLQWSFLGKIVSSGTRSFLAYVGPRKYRKIFALVKCSSRIAA